MDQLPGRIAAIGTAKPAAARFCAVGGSSVVSLTATALRHSSHLSLAELAALSELVEGLLLHDRVLFLGPLDPADASFVHELNADLGDSPIAVADTDEVLENVTDDPAVQEATADLLHAVFGPYAPPLSTRTLNARPLPSRFSDDHKLEFLREIEACAPRGGSLDLDRFASFLRSQLQLSYTAPDRQYVAYYVFRTFLFAAVARVHDGSPLCEGLRKYVYALIRGRLGRMTPASLSKRLYDVANAALVAASREVLTESRSVSFLPLGISYVVAQATTRADIPNAIRTARESLSGYRELMADFSRRILSTHISLQDRVTAYNDLLGSAATYLDKVIEELRLPPHGVLGLLERFLMESLDSLAKVPRVKTGGETAVGAEASGTLSLELLRSAKKVFQERRAANALEALPEIAHRVASCSDLFERLEAVLPVRVDDRELSRRYHDLLGTLALGGHREAA